MQGKSPPAARSVQSTPADNTRKRVWQLVLSSRVPPVILQRTVVSQLISLLQFYVSDLLKLALNDFRLRFETARLCCFSLLDKSLFREDISYLLYSSHESIIVLQLKN